MSASREKKQRVAQAANGPTEKERRAAEAARKERSKTILYTVVGVVLAVLVIALLVWHTGIFTKGKVVATVNGKDYTVAEMGYYYYPTANMYSQYGLTMDAETLRQSALDSLQQYAALAAAAEAEGFTLSEEGAQSVENTLSQIKTYASQNGTTFKTYIRNVYGPYMTESLLRECLTRDTLAQEYYTAHADTLNYTDDELNAYYEEHANELDTFTYSAVFIDGSAPSTTDADGNTVEATDAEKATAMSTAKATADKLLQDLEDGGDFDALAAAATQSDDEESDDEATSYETTVVGASLANAFSAGGSDDCVSWLTNEGREAGDLNVIEVADTGYWVLRFTDRALDTDSYGSADVRHILVKAELTQEDDPSTEDVDESTVPTQEALDAAEAKAQEILDEYNAGDKTADSFGALAQQYSEDPGSAENGGLYEGITPSTSFLPAFIDWTFADGRQPGDTGLVENDQEGQYGWHVMYLQDHTLTWKYTAENALKSDALNTWMEELEGTYPVTTNETNLALLG